MRAYVWRVMTPEAKTSIFVQHCETEVLPKYKSAPGLLNLALWYRTYIGYAEVQIVFIWHSSNEECKFSEDDFLQEIKGKHDYIIIPEQSLSCYDVVFWSSAQE